MLMGSLLRIFRGKCEIVLTESNESHDEDLRSLSKENRQQHPFPRGTENISVHLLPTRFLLCILLGRSIRKNIQLIRYLILHLNELK